MAFAWFGRVHAQRNYHVYATGSLALLLAGCFLSLPPGWLALCTALAAVALVSLAARTAQEALAVTLLLIPRLLHRGSQAANRSGD